LFQHSFLEDGANVFCHSARTLIHPPPTLVPLAAEHLISSIFLHFQLKVSFGKETGQREQTGGKPERSEWMLLLATY